jgi:hypothetical protein
MLTVSMSSSSPVGARAVCVVRDPVLRRTLRRTLNAAGSLVEFAEALDLASDTAALVFIDGDTRKSEMPALRQLIADGGKVVILGESLEDNELVALLRAQPLDHVISDADSLDEMELVVTSVKLLRGDIFGLEKYLAWGVRIYDREVTSYVGKRDALHQLTDHARMIGARRKVIARIESVADELMMNGLYDAPGASHGGSANERIRKAVAGMAGARPTRLRYGCDGRYFAISVTDEYGRLQKSAILDNLMRARRERGRPRSDDSSGAGLGIYFILSSVTRFIANIEPGKTTEVICLFDMRQKSRELGHCARSLHIFTTTDQAA